MILSSIDFLSQGLLFPFKKLSFVEDVLFYPNDEEGAFPKIKVK